MRTTQQIGEQISQKLPALHHGDPLEHPVRLGGIATIATRQNVGVVVIRDIVGG